MGSRTHIQKLMPNPSNPCQLRPCSFHFEKWVPKTYQFCYINGGNQQLLTQGCIHFKPDLKQKINFCTILVQISLFFCCMNGQRCKMLRNPSIEIAIDSPRAGSVRKKLAKLCFIWWPDGILSWLIPKTLLTQFRNSDLC